MIYACVGPTGSGKTDLAIMLAKKFHAPIVNADAFQVYKGMDIGTNKQMEQFAGIHTYLFDHIDPVTGYTVAQYQHEFRNLMNVLDPVNNPVIVVGGTGLYIKASLYDFSFKTHEKKVDMTSYQTLDQTQLYNELLRIDPTTAQSIHPHNRRRVMRAIEIFLQTGEAKSVLEAQQEQKLLYPVRFLGLNPPREALYERINERVRLMMDHGLIDEVRHLLTRMPTSTYALRAIGYKESMQYIERHMDLPMTIAMIQQATRRYAKRQWTYFRNQLPVEWFADIQHVMEVI